MHYGKRTRIRPVSLNRYGSSDFRDFEAHGGGAGPPGGTASDQGWARVQDPRNGAGNVPDSPGTETRGNLPGSGPNRHSQAGPRTTPAGVPQGGDSTLIAQAKKTVGARDPVRLNRAEFGALPELHRLVAQIYLNRGTGEVVLVE